MMRRLRCWTTALCVVGLGACSTFDTVPSPGPSEASPALRLSSDRAPVGDLVAVAVGVDGPPAAVAGMEGRVRFDPALLRYVGQDPAGRVLALVGAGSADQGRLRFVMLDRAGLTRDALTLVFEVRGAGYPASLRLEPDHLAGLDGRAVRGWRTSASATTDAGLNLPADPRPLGLQEWSARFAERSGPDRPLLLPGDGTVYGDVNLNGAINVFDVLAVANVAAGNNPLLPATATDFAVAGDVAPANAPGLGESTDPTPPGLEFNGARNLNVFDALAIANFAAGVVEPVAGQPIPGRSPTVARVVLAGVLAANRTLARDTVYELNGTVIVPGGVTLTIQPGTRLEGTSSPRGALSVRRSATLLALGTRLEPIVFTCVGASPAPGCWGGVVINGASLLNNGNATGEICPTLAEPSGGFYGGCQVANSSGGLQYVRIEFAGAPWPGGGAAPGLALNGVGSATALNDIQVVRAAGPGVSVSGGRAAIRELLLSENPGDALNWNDGWQGKVQDLVVVRSAGTGSALRGANAPNPATQPTSFPQFYGVTIAHTTAGSPAGAAAVLLQDGTAGFVRNLIIAGWNGAGLDINGAESCGLVIGSSISVQYGVYFGNAADFSADVDCVDEVALGTSGPMGNLFADPLLLGPAVTLSPDLRPDVGSPAATPGAIPPSDGFFNSADTHRGGVPIATPTRANIPWYAGWSRGY